jgi:hypothetical protein
MINGYRRFSSTKVFAKAGLDNETSAMYYYQQRFQLKVQCSMFNVHHLFLTSTLYFQLGI